MPPNGRLQRSDIPRYLGGRSLRKHDLFQWTGGNKKWPANKSIPPTLKYEAGMIVAEGDLVIVHGRFSGFGAPINWIAADIVRIEEGILVEHWDVIQDEATKEQSKSGAPMFGRTFPKYK